MPTVNTTGTTTNRHRETGQTHGDTALAAATGNGAVRLFDGFHRAGSLVFGGGHSP
jgi:hypothetical protein